MRKIVIKTNQPCNAAKLLNLLSGFHKSTLAQGFVQIKAKSESLKTGALFECLNRDLVKIGQDVK